MYVEDPLYCVIVVATAVPTNVVATYNTNQKNANRNMPSRNTPIVYMARVGGIGFNVCVFLHLFFF
jgi:hypothetical protein